MSRQCTICGKGGMMAGQRKKLMSRYNPTYKKRKYPNLQWVRLASGLPAQAGKRVKACTRCIKRLSKA